jgi:apolipoprotein D and lipocalin family protein
MPRLTKSRGIFIPSPVILPCRQNLIFVAMMFISIVMAGFLSAGMANDLPTVKEVDLNRYAGLWYEIARLPNSFEKGLECVSAEYTLRDSGKIRVVNKGFSAKKGAYKTARGRAWIPDEKWPGRLKVSFFWPFAGNYYIIELDEEYKYALVGDPSREYLWVLSRTRKLDDAIYSKLLDTASYNGFDTGQLVRIQHDCN